jgi:hypothetical protein
VFAKPWEKSNGNTAVDQAKVKARAKPWNPAPPEVDQQVLQAHKVKTTASGEYVKLDPIKAQAFAKEMLVDFNPVKSMLRAGLISAEDAQEREASSLYKTANRYERHPLVQQALRDFIHRVESEKIVSRERILYGLLEEACYHGPGASASARVAAWGKLAKLMGMELPPEGEKKANDAPGGVMMIPFSPSIEQWEQSAMGQQARLKADVRL